MARRRPPLAPGRVEIGRLSARAWRAGGASALPGGGMVGLRSRGLKWWITRQSRRQRRAGARQAHSSCTARLAPRFAAELARHASSKHRDRLPSLPTPRAVARVLLLGRGTGRVDRGIRALKSWVTRQHRRLARAVSCYPGSSWAVRQSSGFGARLSYHTDQPRPHHRAREARPLKRPPARLYAVASRPTPPAISALAGVHMTSSRAGPTPISATGTRTKSATNCR